MGAADHSLKRSLDSKDYLQAITRGFSELKKWGTTTVCNIEAFSELMTQLGSSRSAPGGFMK